MTKSYGLPLLSGPPPAPGRAESSCRKCNKEFNIIFTRSRQCNHCGYSYCHSCTDYQALMPRANSNGYEALNVCAYCVEFLQMTAASKGALRSFSLAKLRKYANAYNIGLDHAVEKDDVIETLLTARIWSPSRALLTNRTSRQPAYEFPRPDLAPDDPPPRDPPTTTSRQTPTTPPRQVPTTPPRPTPRQTPPRQQPQRPRASRSSENLNVPRTPPRARATSTSPPPTLNQLIEMTPASISALSIGSLKAILFSNHKSDLVSKVTALVEDEKRERERQRLAEEQEEQERIQRQREMMEDFERARQAEAQQKSETDDVPASPSPPVTPPKAPPIFTERGGLCVICQDEEANIAIVDCGHLAMCRGCSDLIMAGSRECPLCRTRIITEARLLRIFKS
ncbi:hypothetical protein EDD85DRAFT_921308 [Armillaria nabsnona]|nr:hypothetical protein EDD85DRAFT_921308 [Armillaria nabsnona]